MTTLDNYRAMLSVNKHRLDDELEIQPDIMMRIASEVVTANGRMIEAKDDLGRIEGKLSEEIKEEDPKLSLPAIAAKVGRHSDRLRAWQVFQETRTTYERWNHLLDAWKQKGYAIKTLADLYAAQYFSTNSTTSPAANEVRDVQLRAEMRKAGNGFRVEPSPDAKAAPEPPPATRRRLVT